MLSQPRSARRPPVTSLPDVRSNATVGYSPERRGSRRRRSQVRSKGGTKGRRRPARVTRHHREHRLDETIDILNTVELSLSSYWPVTNKARPRVGRINASLAQMRLRHLPEAEEKARVETILSRSHRANEAAVLDDGMDLAMVAVDDGICFISSDDLWSSYDGDNAPHHILMHILPYARSFTRICLIFLLLPSSLNSHDGAYCKRHGRSAGTCARCIQFWA